jgi:DNA-binding transcriptional MocR family regulator
MSSASAPLHRVTLDRDSEEPIYRQLIQHIQSQIESGVLTAGMRLPASRDLATTLGISRISVVNAYAELRSEGYLSAHAGRGTFVARDGSPVNRITPLRVSAAAAASSQDYSLRDMLALANKPGIINLSHGAPPEAFFPTSQLRAAINTVLDRDGPPALAYEVAEGLPALRASVRDYLMAMGIHAGIGDILITGGAQQALDLIIQTLMHDGDVLATGNPTYLGILDIARMRRVQIHGLPMDEDGLRVDMLENYLLEQSPRLLYVMPSFHNPTGTVMPLHRRRQLLNLANEHNVIVIEDAVYQEFRFEGTDLPPLKALDEHGVVIYVNAFTKLLLPGMRIGYLVADGATCERLARVKQAIDISTPGLNQRAIHVLLERGVLSQQRERNARALRHLRDAAISAAQQHLPPGTHWHVPMGGTYLWVNLPRTGPTASELFIACVQAGVAFAIGNIFYTNGQGSYDLRLNYGLLHPDLTEKGIRLIGRTWRDLVTDTGSYSNSPLI